MDDMQDTTSNISSSVELGFIDTETYTSILCHFPATAIYSCSAIIPFRRRVIFITRLNYVIYIVVFLKYVYLFGSSKLALESERISLGTPTLKTQGHCWLQS
jgi:hypothetical protein